ncbi:myogenesis-regulating glycosidase-like isoform X3 [Pomacea canaliculata]|uniref:myogenesis-regulating glycosidase-like isoform X3 n=1 Tax=Pomacea canaliculata TaxID=400727 RepID=UPI000D725A0E|nr:myogenesis-regulating glycosidase-like isoform X3 [Pomacea canaliculata]
MESDKTKDREANTEPEEERRDRNLHMYPQCDHPGSASLTVEVTDTMGTKVQFLENQTPKNQMSKKEILAKYRVHIFVVAIFIISVLFISLGWFYRDKTEQEDSARQKIFLDPRKRILTLSDGHDEVSVLLGQDIPQWQLPMHCQLVEEDNPNSKECLWKNNAVVRVNFFQERVDGGTDTVGCYNVSWETLRSSVVPYDCFNLGTAEWYGPSNQSDGTWPVQGNFSYVPTPYRMGNNGVFSNVFQPYWLSSTGVGLLLNADEPITLQWNTSRPGYLCVVSNYTGPLYGQTYQSRLPFLNYTICNGQDINQTHRVMKTLVRGATPVDLIPREVILNPIWSAKELAGTERYNETHIQDFVTKLKTNGMNCSLLVMDGDWQDKHGDLTFDPARFANLANLTELLQTACSLSLEVTPYFDYRSVENFHTVVENFFVRDDGGRVPGLTRYRQTRPAPWWTSRDRKHARGSATP